MRVLFSSVAGYGHVFPLLPLAQAFRDRGDAVAVVTSPSYARHVEAAGLQLLPAGLDEDELNALLAAGWQRARVASTTLRFETAGLADVVFLPDDRAPTA